MTNSRFKHLGLREWPFVVVPDPRYCTFLADREKLATDIESLILHLLRRDPSSIHIFWAWFGAGKTHTLHFLASEAKKLMVNPKYNEIVTVYTEFPRSARSFVDLYRAFTSSLSMNLVVDSFLEVSTGIFAEQMTEEIEQTSTDLFSALKVLATGDTRDQQTALRWLRAEDLPISEFRSIGIAQKINTPDRAAYTLPIVIKLLSAAARARGRLGSRVIWLLDEFQRIEGTGKLISDINTGLHSVFNACPKGLSLILSFSGKPDNELPAWFSPELRDRIGMTKVMVLPPMQRSEALTFIIDLLDHFRLPTFEGQSALFPFSEAACRAIIGEIEKAGDIKPRTIMQAFNAVLEEADPLIEQGKITSIQEEFAKNVILEHIVLRES